MNKKTESILVSSILRIISLSQGVLGWRLNSGATKIDNRFVHFGLGKAGSPDIVAVVGPYGRFVGIECKSKSGKVSKSQYLWGMELMKMGGIYAVVRTVEEALNAIEMARSRPVNPALVANNAEIRINSPLVGHG